MKCLGGYTFLVMTSVILSGGVKMRVDGVGLRRGTPTVCCDEAVPPRGQVWGRARRTAPGDGRAVCNERGNAARVPRVRRRARPHENSKPWNAREEPFKPSSPTSSSAKLGSEALERKAGEPSQKARKTNHLREA